MDANCFHVDQIVNIGILREQVPDAATTPKNAASKWEYLEDSCRTREPQRTLHQLIHKGR